MTELWFMDGTEYLGTVIIRHRLTPALERAGATSATTSSPVTRAVDNLGSRRVVEADVALARIVDGEAHYWLFTSQRDT